MGIEGVMKEGFVTTSVDALINWSKTGSLWPMTFGLACCVLHCPSFLQPLLPRADFFCKSRPMRPSHEGDAMSFLACSVLEANPY